MLCCKLLLLKVTINPPDCLFLRSGCSDLRYLLFQVDCNVVSYSHLENTDCWIMQNRREKRLCSVTPYHIYGYCLIVTSIAAYHICWRYSRSEFSCLQGNTPSKNSTAFSYFVNSGRCEPVQAQQVHPAATHSKPAIQKQMWGCQTISLPSLY